MRASYLLTTALLVSGLSFASHAQKAALGADTLHALPPTLPGPNADPHLVAFGNTYYLYPTTDGIEGWGAKSFSAWSSKDLKTWKSEGVILDLSRDLTWASRNAWVPATTRWCRCRAPTSGSLPTTASSV